MTFLFWQKRLTGIGRCFLLMERILGDGRMPAGAILSLRPIDDHPCGKRRPH